MLDLTKYLNWKSGLVSMLALSLSFNIYAVARVFDLGITLSYVSSENTQLKRANSHLFLIVDQLGTRISEDELSSVAAYLSSKGLIVKESGSKVQIENLVFYLDGDGVSAIESTD